MPWWIFDIFLAFVCLSGLTHATLTVPRSLRNPIRNAERSHSDIEFDREPVEPLVSSGGGRLYISDDEDLLESGSGSGSGMGEKKDLDDLPERTTVLTTSTPMTTVTTTTSRPATSCEKLRQASRQLSGKYVPRCLPNGEFDALQCQGKPGIGDCWCSDLEGKEIPGSLMEAPGVPNCNSGHNLPLCVHQLIQHIRSNKLVGGYRPRCTNHGQFDPVQCHGSICYCVDEDTGNVVTGTEVHVPDIPNCDDDSADVNVSESTTESQVSGSKDKDEDNIDIDSEIDESPKNTIPLENSETIDLDMDIDKNIEKGKKMGETETKFDEDNVSNKDIDEKIKSSDQDGYHSDKVEQAGDILTQPGILAGIIGGSVVLLLCVVLLVMFVVYRMRKKDEGSYPLEEPRKAPNYSYVRAPEKEFYA